MSRRVANKQDGTPSELINCEFLGAFGVYVQASVPERNQVANERLRDEYESRLWRMPQDGLFMGGEHEHKE